METGRYFLLAFLWLIFSLTHSLLAAETLKKYFRQKLPPYFKYYRLCYSVLATLILAFVLHYNFSITDDLLWKVTIFERITAGLFFFIGLLIMLYCIRKYFFEMSGVSVFFKTLPDETLRINGLNRFVRHPLYSGTILFVAGCFLWHPGLANLVSFFCITCYILIGIKYEEKKLIRFFGNDYKNYASGVPMIVPEIFFKKKK